MTALDNDLNTSVALSVIADVAHAGNEAALQVTRVKKDVKAGGGHAICWPRRRSRRSRRAACPWASCRSPGCSSRGRRRVAPRRAASTRASSRRRSPSASRRARREDFARVDAIRGELSAMGVDVQDSPATGKTSWRVQVWTKRRSRTLAFPIESPRASIEGCRVSGESSRFLIESLSRFDRGLSRLGESPRASIEEPLALRSRAVASG